MNEFLKEILKNNNGNHETVLRNYESLDGYIVKNCPYRMSKNGVYPDGSDAAIPSNVMYRILEIIEVMRKKGIQESEYYEKD